MTYQIQKKAVEMRREGASYSDIAKVLKISRATACGWLKGLRLTESEKHLLNESIKHKRARSRLRASLTVRTRKVFKEKTAFDNAEKEFKQNQSDPFFMVGLGMSGVERGMKGYRLYQFSSSDPKITRFMVMWFKKYLSVSEESLTCRFFVAQSHANHELAGYWAKIIGVPIENFQKTVVLSQKKDEKDKTYVGSLSVIVSRQEYVRKLISWQKLTMMYYS